MENMQPRLARFATHYPSALGRAIRATREARGLTQEEVANRLQAGGYNLGRVSIAKTESATRPITVSDVAALAAALDVPVSYLWAGEDLVSREQSHLEERHLSVNAQDAFLEELESMVATERRQLAKELEHINARLAALVKTDGEHPEEA